MSLRSRASFSNYYFIRQLLFITVTCALALFATSWAAAAPGYIAGTWSDGAVHFLDGNLNDLSSFVAGASNPNGIATDGTLIYTGHPFSNEVVAYNFSGVEQFRWSAPISGLQGMELVGAELAIYHAGIGAIEYRNPATGTLINTIPGQPSIEGLTYDGTYLWQLNDSVIYASNPLNGAVAYTIPNPAANQTFGGTGLAASGPNELTVADTNGNWWKISSINGAVSSSGNNGLDMFALKAINVIPEPASVVIAAVAGLLVAVGSTRRARR
jgi:hypothetical protein